MGGFAAAWLLGESIVVWRNVKAHRRIPPPGQLLGVTLLFAVLGVMADIAPTAEPLAAAIGWGLDVAGILNLWPAGLGAQVEQAQAAEKTGTTTGGSTKK